MHQKVISFNADQKTAGIPVFRSGDVVKVHRKIVEGEKERTQVFEGMVIAVKGGQSSSQTITVRKVSGGIGVELIIPVQSPNVEKIEVIKRARVRRSKLYYVRDKAAKALRFRYTEVPAEEAPATTTETPQKEETTEPAKA